MSQIFLHFGACLFGRIPKNLILKEFVRTVVPTTWCCTRGLTFFQNRSRLFGREQRAELTG